MRKQLLKYNKKIKTLMMWGIEHETPVYISRAIFKCRPKCTQNITTILYFFFKYLKVDF